MASKPPQGESNVSIPIKRIRWATQRVTGANARRRRHTIIDRFHRRTSSHGKKRESGATSLEDGSTKARNDSESSETESQNADSQRTIYFNLPLPDRLKDEDGRPLTSFERNKVRTAKYTPLSFVPKNLWFQFQNVANIYFLFIIILSVSHIFLLGTRGLSGQENGHQLTVTLVFLHLRRLESRSQLGTAYLHSHRYRHQRCG
jgi:phospholipid-translocating ATPase